MFENSPFHGCLRVKATLTLSQERQETQQGWHNKILLRKASSQAHPCCLASNSANEKFTIQSTLKLYLKSILK